MRSALHGCRNTSTHSASIGFYRSQANGFDGKSHDKILLGVLFQNQRCRHWNIGRRRIAERSISFACALPIDSEPELFRIVDKVPGEQEDIALKGVRTDQAMPLIAGINAHGD